MDTRELLKRIIEAEKTRPLKEGDTMVMRRVRAIIKYLGVTQERLGLMMGYEITCAKQAVNQFLRTKDPRLSMLTKFANAVGLYVSDLVHDPRQLD